MPGAPGGADRDQARLGAHVGLAGVFLMLWALGGLYRRLRAVEQLE